MSAKILIAEDDEDIHYVYKRWLKGKYDVIKANNGQEAVAKYKELNPDLTLMDIKMPVMTGDVAITEIIDYDPNAIIIAVTAFNHDEADLGVPVLRKGFKKETFIDVIQSGLEGNPVIPTNN